MDECELVTTTINGQRYYVLPDGRKFKSVTTILGEKQDKTALLEWRKRVGEAEANKISTQAANRGTAVHSLAERYVLNDANYLAGAMPVNADSFRVIRPVLDKHVDNILGIELPLYSTALRAAGRTDLVATYDDVTSIIDFKTSKKLKKDEWIQNYFVQATVYSMMFEWIYRIAVPRIVIVIAVDHEPEAQVFIKDRGDYVDEVLRLFRED